MNWWRDHLRRHPRIDGGAFQTVDQGRRHVRPAVSWFASPVLAEIMSQVLERPYARSSPGFTEAALERGRPLFLPRVEDWEAAPSLRRLLDRAGDAAGAELWAALARASVIAYPVRDSLGRMVGTLEVASFDPARPLTREDLGDVSVMADLAALAYERTSFLAAGDRPRPGRAGAQARRRRRDRFAGDRGGAAQRGPARAPRGQRRPRRGLPDAAQRRAGPGGQRAG